MHLKDIISRVVNVYNMIFPLMSFHSKYKWRKYVYFKNDVVISNTCFEGKNNLSSNVSLYNSYVGKGTYIGSKTRLNKTIIGRFCSIADRVVTGFGTHPTRTYVSTFPSFYYNTISELHYTFHNSPSPLFQPYKFVDEKSEYLVKIGNDVWIGSHVLIMDGVKVGDGAIIATGAVVTKDVAPYSIVGGIPAKLIRYRFTAEQIEFLLDFAWWNKDIEWIQSHYIEFQNIDFLYAKYNKKNK